MLDQLLATESHLRGNYLLLFQISYSLDRCLFVHVVCSFYLADNGQHQKQRYKYLQYYFHHSTPRKLSFNWWAACQRPIAKTDDRPVIISKKYYQIIF